MQFNLFFVWPFLSPRLLMKSLYLNSAVDDDAARNGVPRLKPALGAHFFD
jgi:hypothetical protein